MSNSALSESEIFAAAFFFAHDILRPPSPEQWEFLTSERTHQIWVLLSKVTGLPPDLQLPPDDRLYESQYNELLHAIDATPRLPLFESHYTQRERLEVIRENLLFYRAFGLGLREASLEKADHLRRQLEFVGFLCRLEATELRAAGVTDKAMEIQTARRSYLEKHMCNWLPRAVRDGKRLGPAWLSNALALAEELVIAASRGAEMKDRGRAV